MKKILALLSFFLFAVTLSACNENAIVPKNVEIVDHVISWDKVKNAEGYTIHIDETKIFIFENTYDLAKLDLDEGTYNIFVSSKIKNVESKFSNTVSYKLDTKLDTPKNIRFEDLLVTWEKVNEASGYIVFVGEESFRITSTTFDFSNYAIKGGKKEVKVKAFSNNKLSQFSESLTYIITANISDLTKSLMLKELSYNYKLNMKENDFESLYEYGQYLSTVKSLEYYITATSNSGIAEENIISLYYEVVELIKGDKYFENLQDILSYFNDLQELGLSRNVVSEIIYEFATINMEMALEYPISSQYENLILQIEEEIENINKINQVDITRDLFIKYNDNLESVYIDDFIFNNHDEYNNNSIYRSIYYMFEHVMKYGEENKEDIDYWLYEIYPNLYDDFYKIFINIYNEGNEEEQQRVFTFLDEIFYFKNEIYYYQNDISMYKEIIELEKESIETQKLMLDFYTDNKDYIIDSFKETYDFVIMLSETIGKDHVFNIITNLISYGNITNEEFIILKDELVKVLYEFKPTVESFEQSYKMLILSSAQIYGFDLSEILEDTSVLSETSVITIDLLLEFISAIDIEYLNGLEELFTSFDPYVNQKLIQFEVFMYTLDYFKDFIELNKDRYNEVLTDAVIKDMYISLLNNLRSEYGEELIPLNLNDEYETLRDFIKLVGTKLIPTIEVINKYKEIFTLTTSNLLLDQINLFIDLNEVLFNDLDEEKAKVILDFMFVYFKTGLELTANIDLNIDIDQFYHEEKANLIELLLTLNKVSNKVFAKMNEIDLNVYLENENITLDDGWDEQYRFLLYIIDVLKGALDAETKEYLNSAINLLNNEILDNALLTPLYEGAETTYEDVVNNINNALEKIYLDVDLVSSYNYNDLKEEEWDKIIEIRIEIFGEFNKVLIKNEYLYLVEYGIIHLELYYYDEIHYEITFSYPGEYYIYSVSNVDQVEVIMKKDDGTTEVFNLDSSSLWTHKITVNEEETIFFIFKDKVEEFHIIEIFK